MLNWFSLQIELRGCSCFSSAVLLFHLSVIRSLGRSRRVPEILPMKYREHTHTHTDIHSPIPSLFCQLWFGEYHRTPEVVSPKSVWSLETMVGGRQTQRRRRREKKREIVCAACELGRVVNKPLRANQPIFNIKFHLLFVGGRYSVKAVTVMSSVALKVWEIDPDDIINRNPTLKPGHGVWTMKTFTHQGSMWVKVDRG